MPSHRPRAAGLRLGSARLTDRFATHDPPTPAEVAAMRAAAADALRGGPGRRARPRSSPSAAPPRTWSRSLPAAIADRMLTRERIARDPGDPRNGAGCRHGGPSATASIPSGRGSCRPAARSSTPSSSATARTRSASRRPASAKGAILAVDHAGPCLARPPARPRPRLAHLGRGRRRPPTYSPATTRPSVRRKVTPATPRHGAPIDRRRRATSRSRLTR